MTGIWCEYTGLMLKWCWFHSLLLSKIFVNWVWQPTFPTNLGALRKKANYNSKSEYNISRQLHLMWLSWKKMIQNTFLNKDVVLLPENIWSLGKKNFQCFFQNALDIISIINRNSIFIHIYILFFCSVPIFVTDCSKSYTPKSYGNKQFFFRLCQIYIVASRADAKKASWNKSTSPADVINTETCNMNPRINYIYIISFKIIFNKNNKCSWQW